MYSDILYGQYNYADDVKREVEKSDCYIDLMKYLPKYWHSIKEMIEIQKTLGVEVYRLDKHLENIFEQCFIDTATWGLSLWENELGLSSNKFMSYEHRREIIKAKLRGTSTSTIAMIENVASAFSGGEVEVIEHNDKYMFEIKFVGIKGIPSNMQGLKNALEEVKPAHLGIEYSYTFTLWIDVKNQTWTKVLGSNNTWNDVRSN